MPCISVIMPVYNGEKYIEEAIMSILSQTFTDFEFIIINDGSTDASQSIISSYAEKDSRIRVIEQENIGLIRSLNKGLKHARSKYIARMDADDISLPKRLEQQLMKMEEEKLDLCGCHYFSVDDQNQYLDATVVSCDTDLNRLALSYNVPFAHGSVMIRREFLEQHSFEYGQTKFKSAEDYALWIKCVESGANISNVDEFLFKYRDIAGTLSKQKKCLADARQLRNGYVKSNIKSLDELLEGKFFGQEKLNDFEQKGISYFVLKTMFLSNFKLKLNVLSKLKPQVVLIMLLKIIFKK